MSGLRPAYLVARREVRERIRARGFQVATALTLLGVLAIVAIAAISSGEGPESAVVAALDSEGRERLAVLEGEHEALDLTIVASDVSFDENEAREALLDGEIDAALIEGRVLISADAPDSLATVLAQTRVEIISDSDQDDGAAGIAFVVTLLMYLAILSSGYTVASGVVEEKTTRVVELILGAVKPAQLLAGKVFGIGLVSLLQFSLIVITGIVAASLTGSIDLPDATAPTAVLALIFFILGYIFYACAFAAAGAVVSRQEDSQTSTAPLMLVLVAGYIASFQVIDNPDSSLAVALSFLPPVAPMVVPVREAHNAIPPEQLALSFALMLAGCAALIWTAGKIYERAILRMGAPLKFGEVLGLLRR